MQEVARARVQLETLRFWCRHCSLASLPNDRASLPLHPGTTVFAAVAYPVLLLIPDRFGSFAG